MKEIEGLKRLQQELAQRIELRPFEGEPKLVAGADVSYDLKRGISYGVMVVLELEDFSFVDQAVVERKTDFPYLPGFLSFREVPVLKEAFHRLSFKPEVILVDGQGILHPRRLGLASHLGLEIASPTIGIAKKPLVGEFQWPPDEPGAWNPIYYQGEIRGAVLRTRRGVKPVYLSPGHLVDLDSALRITLKCLKGFRIPEPLRQAHLLSQRAKR